MVSASDVDRLFLQAVLSRGVMSSKLAQLLWEKSIEAVNGVCHSHLPKHVFSHCQFFSLQQLLEFEI